MGDVNTFCFSRNRIARQLFLPQWPSISPSRKRAEEALRESEERFRTLVQFSFDAYWETDSQHRFIRQDFCRRPCRRAAAGSRR